MADESGEEFYCRYYVGHKGKFGHEFLEFEIRPDGKCSYIKFFFLLFFIFPLSFKSHAWLPKEHLLRLFQIYS